ncbi:MAG: hypothetical protein Q9162_004794 [Coniocarpon cinnabarinum]
MASYALPSAAAAAPFETRSRSYNYRSPDATPTLDSTGFGNGSATPKTHHGLNGLSIDTTPTLTSNSHARSSSYLAGLSGKVPFRTSSVDDMKKGRVRGESDLGRPSLPTRSATAYDFNQSSIPEESESRALPLELLSGILLPLPYLLSSLCSRLGTSLRFVHESRADAAEKILEDVTESAAPVPGNLHNMAATCALTAGTLLMVGIWGHLSQKTAPMKRRRSSLGTSKEQAIRTQRSARPALRDILLRVVCIALPFLATLEIGGVRTGIILLTAASSGVIGGEEKSHDKSITSSVKHAINHHRWTCLFFVLCVLHDLFWHVSGTEYSSTFRGYLALAKSLLLLPLPFRSGSQHSSSSISTISLDNSPSFASDSTLRPNGSASELGHRKQTSTPTLISFADDVWLTFTAGLVAAFITFVILFFSPSLLAPYSTSAAIAYYLFPIALAAGALILVRPAVLRQGSKSGLGIGLATCQLFGLYYEFSTGIAGFMFMVLCTFALLAAHLETKAYRQPSLKKADQHSHAHGHSHHQPKDSSKFTKLLLTYTENQPLIHDILADKESRRIVYFMCINLGFMFVQTFYALVSGSLGLLSDSIHMFFDCMGLLAGLIASIMSKWPPNARFPYGYGKVETLSGLGNGIFLMIISVEIIWESFERFLEGAELKRLGELMAVSVAGLGRADEFFKERNMHCVIHVDKEGQGKCWCGGDKSLHQRTSSIVPGLA